MDGQPQEEADFSSLPVLDRISHKNWKARVSAYNELAHTFKTSIAEDAPEFNTYTRDPSILAAALKDPNAVAQEQGILCACAFIEFGGKNAASSAKEAFTSAIVEKNIFGTSRAGSKKAIVELCLLIVECDNNADTVFEACIEGLKSKQPKAVAGAVLTMKEIVKQFGAKTVNVKPILKTINTIFAHADKGVRAEGTQLVQELHRWLGNALDPHLADLKPVQQKELTESFAGEEKGVQTRYTRTQQRERALKEAEATLTANQSEQGLGNGAHSGNGHADEDGEEEEVVVEAYDLAEPQPVLNKLPADFYTHLASAKWKDRKELALDPFLEILKKTPRIQDANYEELVRALAGRMTDANIACVISAAGCIECLAKGLRQDFARYRSTAIPPILERCKEKKASVTDALSAALDAIFLSATISDIVEDVVTFAKHKNPQVKEQTFRFLVRSLATTKVAPNIKTDLKPLSDALLAGMDDGFAPVRDSAAEGLGTLHKIVGDRPMAAILEKLDDIKKKKVLEASSKVEVRCKPSLANAGPTAAVPRTKPPAVAKPAVARVPNNSKTMPLSPNGSDKENSKPTGDKQFPNPAVNGMKNNPAAAAAPAIRRPPVLSSAKKPTSSGPTSITSSKATTSSKPLQVAAHKPSANEPLKYRYNQEDAEAQAEGMFPGTLLSELRDSAWKVRLAAMESLQAWVEGDANAVDAEIVVRVLSKSPGWKESNFQVYSKMATLFAFMSSDVSSWSRACSALTIGPLSDKLGDVKLKKPVGDTLTSYAEVYSLQFVLSHAYDPMTKQKAPKGQSEAINWIEQALRDFGVVGLAARDLVEFLKTGLKSSNAAVRTSAIKALVTLRLFVGPDIKTFIQDLNPTLLSTIDTEFDKVASEAPPTPTRQSGDNAQATAEPSGKPGKGQSDPLDDLFPRQDITKLVSPAIIKMMSDANWKQRKEALESVQNILTGNTRLKPNLGDLANALKLRLPDSNKVVQGLALDAIARLANGMNKPFERFAKNFVPAICGILADAKANVRAPALTALDAICDQCGLDCMLQQAASAIEVANPVQRSEVTTWIAGKLKDGTHDGDLKPLIGPIVSCLEDKSADVRKAAQSLLPSIISNTGYAPLLEKASSLKPASRSVILPILENAKATLAHTSTPATAAHSRAPSAASATLPTSSRTSAAPGPAASRPLPAVTRNLKVQEASATTSRSSTPVSRPTSSISEGFGGTPRARKVVASARLGAHTASPAHQPPSEQPTATIIFRTTDGSAKETRASREAGSLKWIVEGTARSDQIDYLQQQMLPHAAQDLVLKMFSRDHSSDRDHSSALATLAQAAQTANYSDDDVVTQDQEDLRIQLLANSDLIFKYITVRLCDTSMSIHLSCLDVIENLLQVMLSASYHLSDYEAAILLPSLILKLGDGKEAIRSRTRTIVRSLSSIYPSSKVFAQLLEQASRAKSARVRSESIEELGNLIQRQGLGVCQPSKALPEIAALLADKDASSRSAALDTLSQAYVQIGDDIFKYLKELAPKEQTLLEERLKRTSSLEPSEVTGAGTPKRSNSRQSLARTGIPASAGSIPSLSSTSSRLPASSASSRRASALPGPLSSSVRRQSHVQGPGYSQKHPVAAHTGSTGHRVLIDDAARPSRIDPNNPFVAITSSNIAESVDALKKVQKAITDGAESLQSQASSLIDAISDQMAFAFEGLSQDTPQPVLRLCKHLMQTLSGFFDNKVLSLAVPKATLAALLGELTKRLLETADSGASEAIVSLSKVLNMVLIRIFHNSDNSACFGSLFLILERVTVNLRDLHGAELASQAKYAELVMKCLWKISKSVKDNLEDGSLDARKLLLDIDQFLQAIPPAEWRRRASDNIPLADMPLRTVKTILQQVVGTFGDAVYDQLSLLDRAENSFVYQYLFRLLNNSRAVPVSEPVTTSSRQSSRSSLPPVVKEVHSVEGNDEQTGGTTLSPKNNNTSTPMSPSKSNDIQMNLALKDIFDKIGNAQESKKGIADLYQFRLQHPEAEARINNWIAATGSFFQSYLRRALSNLASEEADRQAIASTPSSPTSSRPVSYFPSAPSSPRPNGNTINQDGFQGSSASPSATDRYSSPRVTSSSLTAGDEKLDSLKQMFGVSKMNIAR